MPCCTNAEAAGPSGQGAQAAAEEEAAEAQAPEVDVSSMSARQRKLYELQQKGELARKANQAAVVAEKKRERVSRGAGASVGISALCVAILAWK